MRRTRDWGLREMEDFVDTLRGIASRYRRGWHRWVN